MAQFHRAMDGLPRGSMQHLSKSGYLSEVGENAVASTALTWPQSITALPQQENKSGLLHAGLLERR